MPLYNISEDQLRGICQRKIESLEHWLRRIVNQRLTEAYGESYFHVTNANGDNVIKKNIVNDILTRKKERPNRYPREIDAALLNNLIDIISNPIHFKNLFSNPFNEVFPLGYQQARLILDKIVIPRNHLAHANPISVRQGEQLICYTNDIIDSLKKYYLEKGEEQLFNVPTILKVSDSLGNTFYREQILDRYSKNISCHLNNEEKNFLRVGDILTLEIQVDPNFSKELYKIKWYQSDILINKVDSNRLILKLENKHVNEMLRIRCEIITNNEWHRCGWYDDDLTITYKVLPSI